MEGIRGQFGYLVVTQVSAKTKQMKRAKEKRNRDQRSSTERDKGGGEEKQGDIAL